MITPYVMMKAEIADEFYFFSYCFSEKRRKKAYLFHP